MTTQQNVVVMVIGIGRIGKIHASNLVQMNNVNLKYIVDANFDFAKQYILECGLKDTTPLQLDHIGKAYDDVEVNAAIICTPTTSHEEHVIAALKAGKHVMCEKPLAFSLESIQRCYEIAKNSGLQLLCAFNRRFDPTISSAWVNREEIAGNLKSIKVTARDMPRNAIEYLKISGGMTIDQCIHDIDIVRWFAQQNPVTVYSIGHAFFSDIRQIDDVDQIYVILQFPDGSMAHIDANREASYGYDYRAEIFGDKGMIVCDNERKSSPQQFTKQGNIAPEIIKNNMQRFSESYKIELQHFVNVVAGKKELLIKPCDTLWATLICEASRHSQVTGQPIQLADFAAKLFPKFLDF